MTERQRIRDGLKDAAFYESTRQREILENERPFMEDADYITRFYEIRDQYNRKIVEADMNYELSGLTKSSEAA